MKKTVWVVMFAALTAGMVGETRADNANGAAKPSKDAANGAPDKHPTPSQAEAMDKNKLKKPAPTGEKKGPPTKEEINAEKKGDK